MKAVGYLIGSGSMSLGVEAAGFELATPYETPGYSKNAQSWDLNRPWLRHSVQDLELGSQFVGADDATDLVYGNPPCGGLSSITGARHDSPTNQHMLNWLQMVTRRRPRAILMENSSQFATGAGAPIREQALRILDGAGYSATVWLFWSWQLGTPQTRRRAFLVGLRGVDPPAWFVSLEHLSKEPESGTLAGPFLDDLSDVVPGPDARTTDGRVVVQHWWDKYGIRTNDMVATLRERAERRYMTYALWGEGRGKVDVSYLPSSFRKAFIARMPFRIDPAKPAPVVDSAFRLVHWKTWRLLTMREQARLMGYPDDWRFHQLRPQLTAQGVPARNSEWAAMRIAAVLSGSIYR